jgi:hypothetical protein
VVVAASVFVGVGAVTVSVVVGAGVVTVSVVVGAVFVSVGVVTVSVVGGAGSAGGVVELVVHVAVPVLPSVVVAAPVRPAVGVRGEGVELEARPGIVVPPTLRGVVLTRRDRVPAGFVPLRVVRVVVAAGAWRAIGCRCCGGFAALPPRRSAWSSRPTSMKAFPRVPRSRGWIGR